MGRGLPPFPLKPFQAGGEGQEEYWGLSDGQGVAQGLKQLCLVDLKVAGSRPNTSPEQSHEGRVPFRSALKGRSTRSHFLTDYFDPPQLCHSQGVEQSVLEEAHLAKAI